MNNPGDWLSEQLRDIDDAHLRRVRRTIKILPDGWCEFDGQRLRNFASNDYLNFARDPKLTEAARQAISEAGVGSTASALVCGRSPWHEKLEKRIAEFESQPATVLFPSGYAANLGTLAALTGKDDVLFCDRLNHACLIDGARLSRATRVIYDNWNLDDLRDSMKVTRVTGRRWIVTDAVFSMDGRIAPLDRLCDLADEFDATVFIDEAHSTGVFGDHGRGVAELLDVENRNVIRTGTLSKAIGCLGGFVSGSEQLVDFLWHQARTQFFSTALPPAVCAAAITAFDLIRDEPHRREHIQSMSRRLRDRLSQLVTETSSPESMKSRAAHSIQEVTNIEVPDGIGPIVPLILHDPTAATTMADRLRDAGFLVAAIRPPTVPTGTSRLRISLTAAQSEYHIDRLVNAISQCLPGAAC